MSQIESRPYNVSGDNDPTKQGFGDKRNPTLEDPASEHRKQGDAEFTKWIKDEE